MFKRAATTSAAATILALASIAIGGDQPAPPPGAAGPRPLLKQLNEETQSLYHEVQAGVVRCQLPPPKWAGNPVLVDDSPLQKWGKQLDPALKERLEQEQRQVAKGQFRKMTASVAPVPVAATTTPATQQGQSATQQAVGSWTLSTMPGDDVITLTPNGSGAGALRFDAGGSLTPDGQIIAGGGQLNVSVTPGGSFTPNNIGLLLDTQGHILVPICVEKETIEPDGVRVMVGPGQMTMARFVGSDRQANITLLKLDKPLGAPVKLSADHRPREGTLTMFLAPNSGVGRLIIWTNEQRDWGVVVGMDGGVFGFARNGQFLSALGCRPAVDQLIKSGAVQRAKVGLRIIEVPPNDPRRQTDAALGTQPAVRVTAIDPNSPAASAGLAEGDLIIDLNDQSVGDPSAFAAALADPTSKPTVRYLRNGDQHTAVLQLSKDQ
jgi:hypothetical protein